MAPSYGEDPGNVSVTIAYTDFTTATAKNSQKPEVTLRNDVESQMSHAWGTSTQKFGNAMD